MYGFRDVNETSDSVILPSEAMQINGEYIENLVEGYRTLSVSGRESLSPEIDTFETGIRDGAQIKNKRYPTRTIIVKYQLISSDSESFRAAYNQLGRILDVKEAKLIFNDEQDKYFIGTPSAIGEVEAGKNAVVAEFEILCADPFKYSVYEYEAEASLDDNSILLDYEGTYKSYPTLEADFTQEAEVADDGETAQTITGNGDCGYVAFYTENEKIVQLGDPEEIDGANDIPKSQALMNQTFLSETAWGTTAKALWTVNDGYVAHNKSGSVGMGAAEMNYKTTTTGSAGTTTKQLLSVISGNENTRVQYTVTAKTYGRTSSSVTVKITVSAKVLSGILPAFMKLRASVFVGGSWKRWTIKSTTKAWVVNKGYTSNTTCTVSGLNSSTSSLSGLRFAVDRMDGSGTAGEITSMAIANLPVSIYTTSTVTTEDGVAAYYLTPTSYGDAEKWHGPTIMRTLSADASGEVGAENFTLTYKQKFAIGYGETGKGEHGIFQCQVTTATGGNIAGVEVIKWSTGKSASLIFYVAGEKVNDTPIDIPPNNDYFGSIESAVQATTITKSGATITFSVGGYKRQYTVGDLETVKAEKVTFFFGKYANVTPLSWNGLYWAKFVKNNCNTWREIPNKFTANDKVSADCRTGKIYLNGSHTPELGALGNDWEDFYLTPGLNQIGFSYSDWVQEGYEPTIRIKWREVFL